MVYIILSIEFEALYMGTCIKFIDLIFRFMQFQITKIKYDKIMALLVCIANKTMDIS